MLPFLIIVAATLLFFVIERVIPGRQLPEVAWMVRPGSLSQSLSGRYRSIGRRRLGSLAAVVVCLSHIRIDATISARVYWMVSRYIHILLVARARHEIKFLWRTCHQVHHSPARIELLTAFYKHPIEIAADSIISSAMMFSLLGASPTGGAWFNVFAVLGEYFYHSNLRTPHWVGYFLQRPEHHSVHHQLDVHGFNYGDITWWDRLFGTFREADAFAPECGFPDAHERNLGGMLAFRDEY